MERDTNKRPEETGNKNTVRDYEQSGQFFTEDKEVKPGEGLLHHGRPLSDMEIEELRVHKENNKFLGIADTPEVGTGAGNSGGVVPDADDLLSADKLEDRTARDSNFGRNYNGGSQSQNHFIEESRKQEHKKKE